MFSVEFVGVKRARDAERERCMKSDVSLADDTFCSGRSRGNNSSGERQIVGTRFSVV